MVNTLHYFPEQPFFELSSQHFVSHFTSSSEVLAQYYSFIVHEDAVQDLVAVPDGTIDILFRCSSFDPLAVVCGSVKKGKRIQFDHDELYFGARFYPGTAERVLGCPLTDFTEREILLHEVEKDAEKLMENMSAAQTFQERISLFENHYINFHKNRNTIPPLVRNILELINHSSGEIRIQDIAESTKYSTRHINNIFKKYVGISPKLFARIVRFQRCFSLMRQNKRDDYASIAYQAGYYDQAHFINEFKEFSLSTPSQVFAH